MAPQDSSPIILAFSGGLDTSFCVPWLKQNFGRDVITATVDTGGIDAAAAKALALGIDRPLYGVNHLAAHVAVDTLEHGPLPEPAIALLVSGGHSSLLLTDDLTGGVQPLGSTIDDAAGEAFDKVARVLGLPFPGGPHIDRVAAGGDADAIAFPRGLTSGRDMQRHRYDFSFSGLKTSVLNYVRTHPDVSVWFGTPAGASRFDGNEWKNYTTGDGLQTNYIDNIEIAPDGTVCFVTAQAVSCLKLV